MRILLVNPDVPLTFWSFKKALKFISKKAVLPPLGLLTVAAILPREWETKLIDMTTTKLLDRDMRWADYVFITAMVIQRKSADQVIERCRKIGFDNLAPIIWHKIANAVYEVENGSSFLGKPYEPNAVIKNDIEFLLMLRKPGGYRRPTFAERIMSGIFLHAPLCPLWYEHPYENPMPMVRYRSAILSLPR